MSGQILAAKTSPTASARSRAESESWTIGKIRGVQEGLGRDSKAHWCPQDPGSLFPSEALASELPYIAFALILSAPLMNLSFLDNPLAT